MQRGYLTVGDVAKLAGTDARVVRVWIRSGRLASVRCGGRLLVSHSVLERFLRSTEGSARGVPVSAGELVLALMAQLETHARFLRRTVQALTPARARQRPAHPQSHLERRVRRELIARVEEHVRRMLASLRPRMRMVHPAPRRPSPSSGGRHA
ncbi:MAG: helix-turn-helix domain-containing protein [Myxococcota bacterium]